ncbi:hypothetical protein PMN64_11815 [Bradyrhizobium sp. UFLA01-814]|uniref:hypothetical protein n=1 Tax=Bradyrhizobium sp. UFLA01-814 TaxID=3023480 RepID=UPI00398AE2DA
MKTIAAFSWMLSKLVDTGSLISKSTAPSPNKRGLPISATLGSPYRLAVQRSLSCRSLKKDRRASESARCNDASVGEPKGICEQLFSREFIYYG